MEKHTCYLSTGFPRCFYGHGIEEFLTVQGRQTERQLTHQEEALWGALSPSPLDYEQMRGEYTTLLESYGIEERVPFGECLRRLQELGLVAVGKGDFEIEALYDLMRDIRIVPDPVGIPQRAQIAFHLLTHRVAPVSGVRALFPQRRLTRLEAKVLAYARKQPMTTARLVLAEECTSWSAATRESVMDSIDRYGEKAMNVYADMMYSSRYLESVLAAIFALRRNRRVVYM